jgi:mxaJ protein
MSSRCRDALACLLAALACIDSAHCATLTVCADPDNLPYSRADGSGFENRIAALVARDLNAELVYTWMAPSRGLFRKTLDAGVCDLIVGVPSDMPGARRTAPYYRSGYAFVYRGDPGGVIRSLADPRLARLRVGVQLIGADMAATPAAYALAARGIAANVRGYPIMGDMPAAQRMAGDVAHGRLDVALIWGPQAGYFAARESMPLALTLIDDADAPNLSFAISMAVRDDAGLQARVQRALDRLEPEIDRVLDDYGVPRLPRTPPS